MDDKMSDLEMVRRCAQAMGIPVRPYAEVLACLYTPTFEEYWPLTDDAQAMALEWWLIERGYLHYEDGSHMFYSWPLETGNNTFSADFADASERRRAIVRCVALTRGGE